MHNFDKIMNKPKKAGRVLKHKARQHSEAFEYNSIKEHADAFSSGEDEIVNLNA